MDGLPMANKSETELAFHRLVESIVDASTVDTNDRVAELEKQVAQLREIVGRISANPTDSPIARSSQPESESAKRENRFHRLVAMLRSEVEKSPDGSIAVTSRTLAKIANDPDMNGDHIAAFLGNMRKNGDSEFKVTNGGVDPARRATWVIALTDSAKRWRRGQRREG